MLSLIQHFSVPHFRANWGHSALVIGGTATGVALIVAITIINRSVLENLRNTIETIAGPAALQVTLGTGEIGFPQSTTDMVRQDPDVIAAIPLVRGTLTPMRHHEETVPLFGVDLVAEDDLDRYQLVLTTDRRTMLDALTDPHSVLLTERLAEDSPYKRPI